MNPYGNFGGPNKLIEAYIEWRDDRLAKYDVGVLQEADSKADFPEFLFGIIRTALWAGYERDRTAVRAVRHASRTCRTSVSAGCAASMPSRASATSGTTASTQGCARTERPSAPLAVDTYGGVYAITRQLIINDDTGDLLNRNPADMGYALGNFVAETLVALIESNPMPADGMAFFHSDRGNTARLRCPRTRSRTRSRRWRRSWTTTATASASGPPADGAERAARR